MSYANFEYYAPESVKEVCSLLEAKGSGAMVMAGGTDLLVKIRHHLIRPEAVIGLKKIKGLSEIRFETKRGLTIGATALLSEVATHRVIRKRYPALASAALETANVQIRNMGTVVGNLCNGAPSADNAPALIAMNAQVILESSKGGRQVPLDQFFKGPGKTVLKPGEIVAAIQVPTPPPGCGLSYQHISPRGKVDISAVCVGAMVALKESKCQEARIVLGAVAPVPMRAPKAEKLLIGKKLTENLVKKAGDQASQESKPISDVRASADYRKKMVAVLTQRALREALERAGK